MGIDKLVKNLHKNLDQGELKNATLRCDRIDELLGKLEKKKDKLKNKLESETSKSKRKKLALELRIVTLELKKGRKRRKELKAKCDRLKK